MAALFLLSQQQPYLRLAASCLGVDLIPEEEGTAMLPTDPHAQKTLFKTKQRQTANALEQRGTYVSALGCQRISQL